MVGGPALAGIVGLGAVGGILANIALTPLTAGASLLQSYWYGAGLILGERMMYTVHWEKIKGRLDKGEEFLTVLDKIMNDDITAIANLSFKAMDETGKLYLEKAGTGLADFVENLLSAILLANPTGLLDGGKDEPPPEGEPTPTGISLTIAQIQAMSDNTLLFETQDNIIGKYTPQTQAHMLTELLARNITKEDEKETKETIEDTQLQLRKDETQFLIWLATLTLQSIRGGAFAGDESLLRKMHINFGSTFQTRVQSTASDQRLQEWFDALQANREILLKAVQGQLSTTIPVRNVNASHSMIYVHQLIYSK